MTAVALRNDWLRQQFTSGLTPGKCCFSGMLHIRPLKLRIVSMFKNIFGAEISLSITSE